MFNAIVIDKSAQQYHCQLTTLTESDLPQGDVLVEVLYSTINYKDALAITGKSPVVRQFPMIPGIDFVARVADSQHPDYQSGQLVVLNGWGVGEKHWGGLAQKARVNGDWLVPLPQAFSPQTAMAIGTAGYTAMLCVMALERHGISPQSGPVLVTGAAGGVGSIAVTLLAKLGYEVIALSGRVAQQQDFLLELGASEVIPRSELEGAGKPLAKERWAGVIDVVGSHVLANACASTQYGGAVAACGLAGGMDLPASVAPFILRGVSLLGVDSVMCPRPLRLEAWQRLARDLDVTKLEQIYHQISLAEVPAIAEQLLAGEVRGRVIVDVNSD